MIKRNYKLVVGIIIGLLIAGTTVYAATIISSINVGYSNENSKLVADNVQDAIDEVYKNVNEIKNINYISTVEELQTLRQEVNSGDSKKGKIYVLINDLDLGGKFDESGNMLPGSTNWEPIGTDEHPFSGTFDAMGHIIRNLYSKRKTEGYVGLFGHVANGTIKNLGIEDSYSINSASIISNFSNTAMLVGNLVNSTIDNCYNKGKVKGQKNTGGLIGMLSNSTISNCYNVGTVDNNKQQFIGGIVGYGLGGTIKNCYNVGQITGGRDVGGIVGSLTGKVTNTYNLGDLTANLSERSGGIVGQLYTNGSIKSSYNSGISKGGIVSDIYTNANQTLEDNHYLKGKALYGIYLSSNSNFPELSDNLGASSLDEGSMPKVLDIINKDNAFIVDNNKNGGNPILKWESR